MKILFENRNLSAPRVSIILTDWSCRESFHILRYLNEQTTPRDQYEIVWVEFYGRCAPQIAEGLRASEREGRSPLIDRWIVLEMPEDVYYHKHLMYNTGILLSSGEIVVICDSDVMVRPVFVQSILQAFEEDAHIVLHLDEVRNEDPRLYPFSYPTFEEVTGEGCMNWADGKTQGLLDEDDPLHSRNYGACMCARREDLIAIGGADEQLDYLGHICGPYELTFRLVNTGRKEVWHPREFLYHTWHPGTDGEKNYLGPHDGYNMSLTALDAIRTGRIMPLAENPAIRLLRLGQNEVLYESPRESLISEAELESWRVDKFGGHPRKKWLRRTSAEQGAFAPFGFSFKHMMIELRLFPILCRITCRQLATKIQTSTRNSAVMKKSVWDKIRLSFVYLRRMWINNRYKVRACKLVLHRLARENAEEYGIFGSGPVLDLLRTLTPLTPLKITAVGGGNGQSKGTLKGFKHKIVIASFTQVIEKMVQLSRLGIPSENIIRLQ